MSPSLIHSRSSSAISGRLFFLVLLFAPLFLQAQGNEFYSCTDGQGKTVITNRLHDAGAFTCVPFTVLNKEFKDTAAREGNGVPQGGIINGEKESIATAQAARSSAESARIAMEAAHAAAVAAEITAQAVRMALQPELIIITPQSSTSFVDRRFFMPGF